MVGWYTKVMQDLKYRQLDLGFRDSESRLSCFGAMDLRFKALVVV